MIAATLILDGGSVVPLDRLAERVWGEDQPADAAGALQSHISRLRRLLPGSCEIVAEGPGYLLRASGGEIDVVRFEDHYRRACAADSDAERLVESEAALELWRGDPYPDLDDPAATAEIVRLKEALVALNDLRAEALIRLGRPIEAIAGLEATRVENPLRERTVEWLMRAYVSSGRKTDALDAFRALREQLIEETGLDPSPELRELESAIITEEFVGFVAPEVAPTASPRPQIAVPASTFVGRDTDVAEVAALTTEARIVSVVGPGGVGKTRLATHVAAAVADRLGGEIDFIELASLHGGDRLPESVATTLSIQPRANVTAAQRIIDAIGRRHRLIVLDNCEHVIDAAAQLTDQVVRAAPNITFLTTSREPLNIDGEVVVRLPPLDIDEAAVELFADRAGGHTGTPSGGELDIAAVRTICRALDGLPLAIELAAAQLGSMTLDEIVAGVGRPLEMLQRGRRTADQRHRSLRNLIQWSVDELDDSLLAVLTASAAFAGPFDASAVAAVGGFSRPEAAAALADLVDRSLVVVDRSTPKSRFRMLETIRAYAGELLAASPMASDVLERHSEWALGLVAGIAQDLERWAEAEASSVVSAHLADLRLVHQRFHANGDAERALELAAGLHYEAYYGMNGELLAWITETADRFGGAGHPMAETVVASASVGAWQAGDLTRAAEYASRAGSVVDSSAPGAGRGAAEATSDVLRFSGDHAAARTMYAKAATLARQENNLARVVTNLADGAMVSGYLGDLDEARESLTEARRLAGSGPVACQAWLDYAEAEAIAEQEPVAALALLGRAVELAHRSDAAFIIGVTRLTLTNLQLRAGDARDAVPDIVELMEHWRQRGARLQQWITLRSVVEIFERLDAPGDAAAVLGAVLGSGSASELTGPDAQRLSAARESLLAALPDGEGELARWAGTDQDAIVDLALDRLRAHLQQA